MDVSVFRGDSSLIDTYAEEWTALCAEGPCDKPFYAPGWIRAYHEAFAPNAELVFIVARESDRLRGLLPLVARRWRGIPWGRRSLQSMANVHSPRFDVIHGAGDTSEVADAIVAFLHSWRGWDAIQCRMVPEDGVLSQVMEQMDAANAPLARYDQADVPYVDLDPAVCDTESLVSHLSRRDRSNVRRGLKRMNAHGEVHAVSLTSACPKPEVTAQLDALYRLEAAGWKGEAGTAMAQDARLRAFYGAIVDVTYASDRLHLFRLEVNGEPVAMELLIADNTQVYSLKNGINEDFRECSPGQLLRLSVLEYATNAGFAGLDFGGKSEPHKRMWTEDSRRVSSFFMFAPTTRGRVLHTLLFGVGSVMLKKATRFKPVNNMIKAWVNA